VKITEIIYSECFVLLTQYQIVALGSHIKEALLCDQHRQRQ